MKKLISILLAMTFVVSAMTFTASAAGEYFAFAFDEGIISGGRWYDAETDPACITGTYNLTTRDTALEVRAWAVAATGISEVQYNFNGGEWKKLPETAFAARDDIYADGAFKIAELAEKCTAAAPTPQFSFSIPYAELGLTEDVLGSTYTFQIKLLTVGGEEITIVDIFVYYTEYVVDTTVPMTPAEYGACSVSFDELSAWKGTEKYMKFGAVSSAEVNPAKADAIVFWGWISVDHSATWANAFGYSIDGGEIVYDDGTKGWNVDAEPGVVEAGKYDWDSRYQIFADITGLALGAHTIKAYCKLDNGVQIIIKSVTVTLTDARSEVIPNDVYDSIDAFKGQSVCTFDYDFYLEGADLNQSSSAFGGSSPFRTVWSPRTVDGVHSAAIVGYDKVVDEATGTETVTNKYGILDGFYRHYSDYQWNGAYTYTVQVRVPDDGVKSRGISVNFARDERKGADGNVMLYESFADAGVCEALGMSGINVLFPDMNTMVVAVLTFDDATYDSAVDKSGQGAIYATYTLPNAFATFATVEVTDDGAGNVYVSVNGTVISKVTYADAGMFANLYDQGYYKTATITDYNNGGVVASTDKALISKYKTVGTGTRSARLDIDNFEIITAKSVTEPEIKTPAALTVNPDSKYTVDEEKGMILVRMATVRGESLATFASNIATNADYYQVVDKTGKVVESVTRLTYEYSVQILDADGTVVKTYSIVMVGDADGNGRIMGADVTKIKTWVKDRVRTPFECAVADFDGNGRILGADATKAKMVVKSGF